MKNIQNQHLKNSRERANTEESETERGGRNGKDKKDQWKKGEYIQFRRVINKKLERKMYRLKADADNEKFI